MASRTASFTDRTSLPTSRPLATFGDTGVNASTPRAERRNEPEPSFDGSSLGTRTSARTVR